MASFKSAFDFSNPVSRTGLIVGVIVVVLLTLGGFYWLLSTKYEVLFSNMEAQDAAGVVSELNNLDVAYSLADAGTTIKVPDEQVHSVRLQLMDSKARLNNGVGFELFDNSDFGMTEYAQKINYQRALQGELTRTITSLEEVKFARVHLALPEHSLFKNQDKPASASVTLFMNSSATLSQRQVRGIQKLVASSVSGLDISGVTVVNENGVTLSRNTSAENGVIAVSERLNKRQEVENYLKKKVTAVLERAFGPGQAIVSIDVSMNMDLVKTTREDVLPDYDGDKAVLRRKESKSGSVKKDKFGNITTEVEYRLGRKVDQIVMAPGGIKKINVGVLVPENTTLERLEQIRELVSVSVGLNVGRGDEIVVHAVDLKPLHPASKAGDNIVATSYRGLSSSETLTEEARFKVHDNLGNAQSYNGDNLVRSTVNGALPPEELFSDRSWEESSQVANRAPSHAQAAMTTLLKDPLNVYLMVMLAVLFLTLFILKFRSFSNEKVLTKEEREKMLLQLREWLEDGKSNQMQKVN